MAVLGLLVVGSGFSAAGPVLTANVVSFVLVRGSGLTLGPGDVNE